MTDMSNRLCRTVGSQKALEASTKYSTVCDRIAARSVGMRIRLTNVRALASVVRLTADPTFSMLPRRGSRMLKARIARIKPGSAAMKKAVRQP